MEGHEKRVGALAWSTSQISSGSRDKSILQRDIRARENHVSKLSGHNSEVRCHLTVYIKLGLTFWLICSSYLNLSLFTCSVNRCVGLCIEVVLQ